MASHFTSLLEHIVVLYSILHMQIEPAVIYILFGISIAMTTVEVTIPAVMQMNRFCGMGSWTWSSFGAWEQKSELMLARQGKIIRGKLTTTDRENPANGELPCLNQLAAFAGRE